MSLLLLTVFIGVVIRTCLFALPQVTKMLMNRVEVSTPVTSWKRVIEGLELMNHSQSHNGDSYHGSTLMLVFGKWMQTLPFFAENTFFLLCDLISAVALYKFASTFLQLELKSQNESKSSFFKGVQSILLKESHVQNVPVAIFMLYFLNPFTISTCVVKSTLTIGNMFIALFLYESVCANVLFSTLYLALSSYENLYTLQLLFAATLFCYKYNKNKLLFKTCIAQTIFCFVVWFLFLIAVAYMYENSLNSVFEHIYFMLTVPDQTPNIGIFWYFFTEIFDHFQLFFLFVFQFHVVIFSLPLSIKLKNDPVLLAFITIAIISVFKSYPTFGDAGLWMSLLPMWSHTFRYLRFHIVGSVMALTAVVLCPVMWNLWIYAQSANANFFFAATLVYNTAQIFILADIVRAYLEWHIHLKQGLELTLEATGEKARLRLLD